MAEAEARYGHISAAIDGKLYVWGGCTRDFAERKVELLFTVHCYDPLLKTWTKHQCSGDPPPGLYLGAYATVGHYVYVYGGSDGANFSNSLHQLDTRSLTWKQLSSTGPMRKIGCKMVVHDGKLILFGGLGFRSGSIQPGAKFMSETRHSDGRGRTNELHTFDLELGKQK